MFERAISLITLLSLFVLGPPFGRAILLWGDARQTKSQPVQHILLGASTMAAMILMIAVYGAIWKVRPSSVAWYGWMATDLPIAGNVDVTGSVSADISEPLRVRVESGTVDVSGSTVTLER